MSDTAPPNTAPDGLRRSSLALAMLCAWNGIEPGQEPPAWWHHPSDANRIAWERVAAAARAYIEGEQ